MEYLKKLGHTKIGFFSAFLDSMVSNERYEAFLKAMNRYGLEVNEDMIAFGHYSSDSAKYHIPKIIEHNPTAILCSSDTMAYGALSVCREMNINVPEDISIIGFDDIDLCKKSTPQITTIRQNRLEIGKCAYISLESIIRKVFINKTTLRPKLIKRKSVKNILETKKVL